MRKNLAVFSLISLLSITAQAQWSNPLGADEAGSDGVKRTIPPSVRSVQPPFLKGAMPLSETWDPNIAAFGNNPDGMTVNCFAADSDNLYVGGDFRTFDTVLAGYIAQYNRKTRVWSALDRGLNNDVQAIAIHHGKLYAAGDFSDTYNGGNVLNNIAMWDGTSWQNMGGGTNGEVDALAFVGDTLYAGGSFTQAGGVIAYHLAFWDGQSWHEAFGGTSGSVLSLVGTHDSLFVGGTFSYAASENRNTGLLARGTAMLQNGNWTSFGSGYYNSAITLYKGQLWAGGQYFGLADGSQTVNQIAYWDGSNWNAVVSDTMVGIENGGEVNRFLVIGDTLLVIGGFSSMAGVPVSGIAMLHNGTWSELAGGIYGYGNAAISFNGSIYVGGRFTKAGSVDAMGIASLYNGTWTPLASLQYTNVGWWSDDVRAIATTSRYVFIGGNFETIAGEPCNHVAAWDKELRQWITLGPGVNGDVYSLAVQGNNLIVGGEIQYAGAIPVRHIAMCNITTKRWSTMGTGAFRSVGAITVDTSGSVYAAISESQIGGRYYDYLGKWNGTNWSEFGNGLEGYFNALAWQGPILYAAGSFRSADDGTIVNRIAQIRSGGSWGSLNSGLNYSAYALAPSGDSLYVGGGFTQADGQPDSALAVWNPATQVWNPIGASGFNGPVFALAADGKGGVYAGGEFSEVAQAGRGNLVHWNGSKFGTVGSGVDNTVDALAIDPTALYAGGWFLSAGSSHTTSLHFGALNGAGAGVKAAATNDVHSFTIYPNPSSASSTISLNLSKPTSIRLELFNSLGSRIATIASGYYATGPREFSIDASKLASGLYFLRLTTDRVVTSEHFVVSR